MFGNHPNQIAIAKQRLAARRGIPQGAQSGAMAGQPQYNQPQYGMQQYQGQQYQQPVPYGAPDGSMGQCGPWGDSCSGPIVSPFMGASGPIAPFVQNQSLLGVMATPMTFGQFCLSITCGNKFFYGCGARAFTPPNQLVVTSIISGFNGLERTCGADAGFDVAFWNTDDCYCPFDWGCFSNLAPLTVCFDPIDTLSVLPFLNMVIVGKAVNFFNDCWPGFPGNPGGNGGGGPVMIPGAGASFAGPGSLTGFGPGPGSGVPVG